MTWTFASDFTLSRDQVRSLIPDIDSTNPLVTDETIAWYLTLYPNVFRAAAACCRQLAGSGSTEPDFSLGGKITQQSSQTPSMWRRQAASLTHDAMIRSLFPIGGGYKWSDRDAAKANEDTIIPYPIRQDQFDEPFTEEPIDRHNPLTPQF